MGSFLVPAPDVGAASDGAAARCGVEAAGGVEDAGGAGAAAPPLLARVACTSFSVMVRGGFAVTMVAVRRSLA